MQLKTKKNPKKGIVTVVGLGYVGLPLACLCVEKGYKVFGVAQNRKKLKMINKGFNPLVDAPELDKTIASKKITAGDDFKVVSKSKIVVICVPTPIDKYHDPDLTPLKTACRNVAKYLKKGALVVLESTIYPGVSEEVVKPLMDKVSGLEAGRNYYLAHSPERVNPGDPKWKVRNIPRVVGAISNKGLKMALKFYKSILDADVRGMKSIKEAEATKVIENSFRDVNIAFVNELAKSFSIMGIDLYNVLQGSATKPFAFMPHWPSIGVGGHCIPVDPYYLIERARKAGFEHKFLKLAREINNSMPKYTVDLLVKELNHFGLSIKKAKIGVLGLSYKANVRDLRESPSLIVIKLLREMENEPEIYDPYVLNMSTTSNLDEFLKKVEAVIVAVNHNQFVDMDIKKLKKFGIKIIIDGKNCLDKDLIIKEGIRYKGIGR